MKPSIPAVLDRFVAYYRQHPAWGSLHVVLDDGNVEDGCVLACIEWAEHHGDTEGASLAKVLLEMSKTQRLKLPDVVHRRTADEASGG
jgi:hypothetical protein